MIAVFKGNFTLLSKKSLQTLFYAPELEPQFEKERYASAGP